MAARGRRIARWRIATEFPLAFLKAYAVRRYALYGWWGIVISVNFAYTRFLRLAKAYEQDLCEQADKRGEAKAGPNLIWPAAKRMSEDGLPSDWRALNCTPANAVPA